MCKLERPVQPCEIPHESLKELLIDPDINPCFASNDNVGDCNHDGDNDEEMDIILKLIEHTTYALSLYTRFFIRKKFIRK